MKLDERSFGTNINPTPFSIFNLHVHGITVLQNPFGASHLITEHPVLLVSF